MQSKLQAKRMQLKIASEAYAIEIAAKKDKDAKA